MSFVAKFRFQLRSLFGKRKLDEQLAEEVRTHVELAAEANIAAGMTPEEARYAALREFGNVGNIQQRSREQRGWLWVEHWVRDFHFSLRSLRRSSGFSAAVILTLALCIGANTTIFSALYAMVLKPLPFHAPRQLVEIYNSYPKQGMPKRLASVAQYLDYKANADLFDGFALWRVWSFNIGEDTDPDRGVGALVTADYFTLLGLPPLLGRFYTTEECVVGKDNVVVLSYALWVKRYGADPGIIGQTIRLDSTPYTVIGVAPAELASLNTDAILFRPFAWAENQSTPQFRHANTSLMYSRIKSGVALSAALAQLNTLEANYQREIARPALKNFLEKGGHRMGLGRVRAEQTKSVRTGLLLLQGSAAAVLLLGCVNVANLLLARTNARRGELAVRQALGAGRGALIRQVLVESLLLALAGALIGCGLAWAGVRLVNANTFEMIRELAPVVLDRDVLGLTFLGSVVVAGLIGLLPILTIWRGDLIRDIQGGARTASASGGMRAASGLLVTAQVALALMLLVGAGLLIRSFARVMAVDSGIDTRQVIHGRVALNPTYQDSAARRNVQEQIKTRFREIPGVEELSLVAGYPLSPSFMVGNFPITGSPAGKDETQPSASVQQVSPGFFATLGIRLLEGRDFNAADALPQARQVYVVDRNFARKYFPGRSPVGETFDFKLADQLRPVIIGVVDAAKFSGLEDRSGVPFVYTLLNPAAGAFSVQIRTDRPLGEILPLLRAKLRDIDPALPFYAAYRFDDAMAGMHVRRRGIMLLLATCAGIALMLSAVGIYGMLAYDVSQRTREIGIRGAIGASRGQIVALILRQGLGKTLLGLLIGLVGAFYLRRYLSSLLFEVKPTDALSFVLVPLLLLAVAFLASWLPARRAAKIDPVIALRAE